MKYENVQQLALENNNFRKVLFTNKHSQVVLMSILPGEDIGREVHEAVDQVLYFVKGTGQAVVGAETHNIGLARCLPCQPERNIISLTLGMKL
jgi:mannose-6-phosphate isomerase-like protein (cupin superfamily)